MSRKKHKNYPLSKPRIVIKTQTICENISIVDNNNFFTDLINKVLTLFYTIQKKYLNKKYIYTFYIVNKDKFINNFVYYSIQSYYSIKKFLHIMVSFIKIHYKQISIIILLMVSFFLGKYSSNITSSIYSFYQKPEKEYHLKLQYYTTKYYDTVSEIADKFNISEYTLKVSNTLYNKEIFNEGEKLVIPNENKIIYKIPGTRYTLLSIAKKFYVPVDSIVIFNPNLQRILVFDQKYLPKGYYVVVPQHEDTKFIWPTHNTPYVFSGFGWRRSPFNKRHTEMHLGIDIIASYEDIYSVKSGIVTFSGIKSGYGRCIIINHDKGFTTVYAHMSSMSVRKGAFVIQGQHIGKSGNTGRSTGPHLHFEIRKNNRPINPLHFYWKDVDIYDYHNNEGI